MTLNRPSLAALLLAIPSLAFAQATTVSQGIYNNPPVNPAIGKAFPLQLDASGNLKTTTGGAVGGTIIAPTSLLPYAFNNLDGAGNLGSQAAEACHVIKANPGNIYYLDAHELAAGGATDYVFVINVTACPSNGAMTAGTRILSSGALAPTQTWSWDSGGPIPMPASAGIVIACSTTDWPTLTLDTAHCWFNWGYE